MKIHTGAIVTIELSSAIVSSTTNVPIVAGVLLLLDKNGIQKRRNCTRQERISLGYCWCWLNKLGNRYAWCLIVNVMNGKEEELFRISCTHNQERFCIEEEKTFFISHKKWKKTTLLPLNGFLLYGFVLLLLLHKVVGYNIQMQ